MFSIYGSFQVQRAAHSPQASLCRESRSRPRGGWERMAGLEEPRSGAALASDAWCSRQGFAAADVPGDSSLQTPIPGLLAPTSASPSYSSLCGTKGKLRPKEQ